MKHWWLILALLLCFVTILTGCEFEETSADVTETPAPTKEVEVMVTPVPIESDEEDEKINGFTIQKMEAEMYAEANLNVRAKPEKDGERIGRLKEGEKAVVTGRCEETGWYRIDFDGETGFVSDQYMTEVPPKKAEKEKEPKETVKETERATEKPKETKTPKPTETPEPEKTPKPTEKPEQDNGGASGGSGSGVTVPSKGETEGNLVWVPTNGGTKYHNNAGCSNMEDPIQVSIETAKANGYTACKRCH